MGKGRTKMADRKKDRNKTASIADQRRLLHKNLNFAASEQYKLLRTNLQFTLPENNRGCSILGITSAMRGEGKSTTSVNLAYTLAEAGKKVLLIDGDLRLPSIAKKMDIAATPGLSNLLLDIDLEKLEMYKSNQLDNWYILPAGDIPPNPSELLGSARMEKLLGLLAEKFDVIVIDLPPINLVSDALALSSSIDGIVLVVREGYTERREFSNCVRQIQLSNVKILGCVMNVVKSGGGRYGKYRKYYKSRYYYKNNYYYYYQQNPNKK